EQLSITGQVEPEVLRRGIFDAVVYRSAVSTRATFKTPDLEALDVSPEHVQWSNAHFVVGIKDLGGISTTPVVSSGGITLESEPVGDIYERNNIGVHNAEPGSATNAGRSSAADCKPDVECNPNLKASPSRTHHPPGKPTDD